MTIALLAHTTAAAQPNPTGPWTQYADPPAAGFSPAMLDAACALADSVRSAAVMAVYRGTVIVACGDVARELELHSIRKSLVAALYGPAIAANRIDPETRLAALDLADDRALTDAERQARIIDLLAARSGIYLPAAYAPSDQDEERPARGSHPPGTRWFYNNWDFNVAGVLYERLTGDSLYRAFARDIARPIGMEDYAPEDNYLVFEPSASRHPAHTFRMSTRDLARFGQLILQEGRWNGTAVIPRAWVRRMLERHSTFESGAGYGLMWWIHPAGTTTDRYPTLNKFDFVMGRGTGGQALFVIPGAEMVIVHRGDTDRGRGVRGPDVWRIAEMILAARTSEPSASVQTVPLRARSLRGQAPAPAAPRFLPITARHVAEIVGDYRMPNDSVIRVFTFRDRPYAHFPGRGDAELFRVGGDEWTVRVASGVRILFLREGGVVSGVEARVGPEIIPARRIDR